MTEKQMAVDKARKESAEKWERFFDNGGKLTSEVKKQIEAERKEIERLGKIATEEWLKNKGLR